LSRSKSSQSPLPLLEPRNPKQGRYARLLEQHELVFAVGPAGTGKTYIAAHRAANVLADGGNLIIIRPTVTVEDEDMGFLPGDLQEKIDPYMKPVMQELTAIAGKDRTRLWAPQIECCPIAYIRGRTFL
jgi:phosphate starvation-inducible PhoH-like protein